eukprot:Sspe_Gene.99512::Locus_73105_Transcript_1_2_Confidence_0.667_Length_1256::g.99512::m.99512
MERLVREVVYVARMSTVPAPPPVLKALKRKARDISRAPREAIPADLAGECVLVLGKHSVRNSSLVDAVASSIMQHPTPLAFARVLLGMGRMRTVHTTLLAFVRSELVRSSSPCHYQALSTRDWIRIVVGLGALGGLRAADPVSVRLRSVFPDHAPHLHAGTLTRAVLSMKSTDERIATAVASRVKDPMVHSSATLREVAVLLRYVARDDLAVTCLLRQAVRPVCIAQGLLTPAAMCLVCCQAAERGVGHRWFWDAIPPEVFDSHPHLAWSLLRYCPSATVKPPRDPNRLALYHAARLAAVSPSPELRGVVERHLSFPGHVDALTLLHALRAFPDLPPSPRKAVGVALLPPSERVELATLAPQCVEP